MKQLFLALIFMVFAASTVLAQGIDFFHGSLEEAMAKAKTEEKLIFMDCFTSWCGPCKRMSSQVFTDPEVGAFFNENFINLKKDMEKEDGPGLADRFVITSYPSLLFLNADGSLAQKKIGAMSPEAFLDVARSVLGKTEQLSDWSKLYEAGDRKPETMLGYVRVLNRAGKPSIKVANEYLKTQKDLTTEFNLKFLFEALTEADSHIFDLFLENKDKIGAVEKSAAVDGRIEKACGRTLKKAIEFRSLDLLREAQKKMEKAVPARAEKWNMEAEMSFFGATNDLDGYLEACKDCQKKEAKGDASKLYQLAKELSDHFPKEPKALKQAEKWSKTAAENGGLFEYWMQYAQLLKLNGKPKDARQAAQKGKKVAAEKNDASMINQVDSFINQLDEESKS